MFLVLFLANLLCSKKLLLNFEEALPLFMISAAWSVNFQMVLLFYLSLSFACLFTMFTPFNMSVLSTKKIAC